MDRIWIKSDLRSKNVAYVFRVATMRDDKWILTQQYIVCRYFQEYMENLKELKKCPIQSLPYPFSSWIFFFPYPLFFLSECATHPVVEPELLSTVL